MDDSGDYDDCHASTALTRKHWRLNNHDFFEDYNDNGDDFDKLSLRRTLEVSI